MRTESKLIIGYMIFMMVGMSGMIYLHEQVHVIIYDNYGIESHVEYLSHFPKVVTIAEEPCPTETCSHAHIMNEVVGYPLQFIYFIIATGFLVLFILIDNKGEKK